VSEQTIEAPAIPASGAQRPGKSPTGGALGSRLRAHPWVIGTLALLAVSALVILWAGTRPGFDPFGWIVWGRQTLHWNLDTNGAPSWKPLPYLFTVPYALVGHYELWLWILTAVAGSLAAVVFAARIAYRLTGPTPERRYAAIAAAILAGLLVLGIRDYAHFILSSQSDTVIVALCLGAIDCHLCGRFRIAFILLVLASLGRPEAWPFVGLYAFWLLHTAIRTWILIAAGLLSIPLLWFGIPALTAKSWFVAGNLALNSPRALHENKITGVIDRFLDLHELPVHLAALVAIAFAIGRRDRPTLVIAGAAFTWVVVEIAFALHGWPAVPRYLFEPVAVVAVLAGVGVGQLAAALPRLTRAPALGPVAVSALLLATLVPSAQSRVKIEGLDLKHERARTVQIGRLRSIIVELGGAKRILACGQPVTEVEFQSVLAWDMGLNVGETGYQGRAVEKQGRPVVLIEPVGEGWKARALHPTPAMTARCAGMVARTSLT
jgi:hypothetical protein